MHEAQQRQKVRSPSVERRVVGTIRADEDADLSRRREVNYVHWGRGRAGEFPTQSSPKFYSIKQYNK